MRRLIDLGGDRVRGNKPVPRYQERILYALTRGAWPRRCAQDLDAALPQKHMHHILLANECVALAHIDGTDRLEIAVDRLHESTRAHIEQESLLIACAYNSRVHESVRAHEIRERPQCPGLELPTRRVLMVHRRGAGGRGHLYVVGRRINCNLVLGGNFTDQAPDFLVPVSVVKYKIPAIVLASGFQRADVRL